MGYKEVESSFATFWTPEKKGDAIEGAYLGDELVDGGIGSEPFLSYRLRKADGSVWGFSGGMLGSKMDQIPAGATVKVVYEGTIKVGKRGLTARDYKVLVDDSATLLDPNSPESIAARKAAKARASAALNGNNANVEAAAADDIPF